MSEKPRLIKTWDELRECTSNTHILEIDMEYGNGWVKSKSDVKSNDFFKHNHYLSTHTFYGTNYEHSTKILQDCGFNIQLVNWDE